MSSLALMRLLESTPDRYDAGMRALTLGRVRELREAVAEAAAQPGAQVLEIGCGTGSVTERLLARGARVTALDQNPEMLERSRERLAGRTGAVEWLERTASEIDALPEAAYDAVVASLSLSEMSAGERAFVLRAAARRLRPGGVLAVCDEVRPRRAPQRLLHGLLRVPQVLLAWLVVGSVSSPIPDLAAELRSAGFSVRAERRWLWGSLAALIAERPA
ncbi:MAG: class I SAM-dependent methyltransferase [Deltaproteobacteria bacterium]|nr:MAG: class I SAM-dependent methyltransferase [Deltaproteobacteria bacterium]